jgi:hypothetical protein
LIALFFKESGWCGSWRRLLRRLWLAEDKLERQKIVIELEEVKAQPGGWKRICEEWTSQLDWGAPKIINRRSL